MGKGAAGWRSERGQAVPLMAVAVVFVGVLAIVVARMGQAALDASRAQAAADAAALAGAVAGRPAADRLATTDGGRLLQFRQIGADVLVAVRVGGALRRARARPVADPGTGPDGPVVGGWSLPVPRGVIGDLSRLAAPHHDYPALDLPVPTGTPVYALTGGTVHLVTDSQCGNGVSIDVAAGARLVYCHGTAHTVADGTTVRPGQQVLISGSTGHSTGPHLHIGISIDGRSVCPQPLLLALARGQPPPAWRSLPATGCST